MIQMKYYIVLIAVVGLLASCSNNKASEKKPVGKNNPVVSYQLATAENAGVTTIIKLPAQLAAYEEVSIFPKVNGYVKTVKVDIGQHVSKGTVLMILEAPELQQASLQAKEKYTRARADLSIDREHYQRLIEAAKTAGAVSPLDLSTAKVKIDADSALCNAEKANWQMQQAMLDYLKVTAPFDGVITERNVHPGALVSATMKDKPMLELKQAARLRLQVDVPEGTATALKTGDAVSFMTSAYPGKKMTGIVSRKSSNINVQYRSERIEIDVLNKDGLLSPGMYADVLLQSKGSQEALSVPISAVVTSTERKYVLAIRDGKTVKVDVSTGNETSDRVEVYGPLQKGEKVIINANDEIK
ncbi:MAG: efflux RND transporter periplasmic adaptor subunit [Sediminibacterium sp.]